MPPPPDADLLIVGGGPAGLATAIHARRAGLSVIIADPRPAPIDKACGEGIMPGGMAELAALGVDPPGVPLLGITYVDGAHRAEAHFRTGPGRGVRRTALHTALTAAAQAHGVQWTPVKVTAVHQSPHTVTAFGNPNTSHTHADHPDPEPTAGHSLTGHRGAERGGGWKGGAWDGGGWARRGGIGRGGGAGTEGVASAPGSVGRGDESGMARIEPGADAITARWLVAADGLHSTVRRCLGVRATAGSPRRYGLRSHWGTPGWSSMVEVWWSPWGEAYVTPVAENVIGVAILSSHRPDLGWFPELAHRLASAEPVGAMRGAGPLRQVVARRVAGRVLFVGDAAGYEDALTGEGVSLALKQAVAAVDAIVAGQPGRYEARWRRITREYRLLTRGLVLATAQPALRRAIVPASARLPAVFGAIVNRLAR